MLPHKNPSPEADRQLAARVEGELARGARASLRSLEVDVARGIVTLRGCVHSFYERQLAIQCCRTVEGIRRLVDAVEVA